MIERFRLDLNAVSGSLRRHVTSRFHRHRINKMLVEVIDILQQFDFQGEALTAM